MSEDKNANEMELEENPKVEHEQIVENNEEGKNKEKKNTDEKPKKKIIKRAPMEKTVDDTIKEFDKLLQEEVNNFINF